MMSTELRFASVAHIVYEETRQVGHLSLTDSSQSM